jgi:ABC-type phosphate transport system substrate-binding protein
MTQYHRHLMTFTVTRLAKMLALALLLAVVSSTVWAKEVALVVGKSTSLKGLQSVEVTKAFKTAPPKWADGKEIVFVIKAPSSSESRVFGTKLLNQTVDQLAAYFSNAKKTFVVVATDEEVIKTVSKMPNAIGVVDLYSINSSVTVLKIDGKLPLEPGYLLHYN